MLREETQDLRALTNKLTKDFPQIETLYLFGSRRYRTGSSRSDIDVLVKLAGDSHIRPVELRAFSSDHCRALDFFVAEGGKAVSCANESQVRANTFEELVTRLEAVCFWNKTAGFLEAEIDWEIKLATDADFAPTSLTSLEPIAGGWSRSFQAHLVRYRPSYMSRQSGTAKSAVPRLPQIPQWADSSGSRVLRRLLPHCRPSASGAISPTAASP